MRAIDGDSLISDCQLAQKQADRHGREFANAFYSGGGEVSTEWWCVEDMIENAPTIEPEPHWIPCSERMPEEDHWLGGSGRQFSEKVMVTIVNHSDEDTWVDMTYTIDGEWVCELPKYCKIVAWMPLPETYREGRE